MNEVLLIFTLWVFVVGLCIGSFLNVVILRGLSGESIVFPSSKCPVCQNKLKWWMNIPLLSYLLIRGKCHYCKTKVSMQYPIVEFITGVTFVVIFLAFGFSFETLFFITAFCLLEVMTACDLKESVIIDTHSYILMIAGVLYNVISPNGITFLESIIGLASGFLLYELLARLGYIFAGQRAFGEGDSLIAAGIGAFFGWRMMIVSTALSVIIMAVCTLPYFFIHSYKSGKKTTCISLLGALALIIAAYINLNFGLIKTFLGTAVFVFFVLIGTILCVFGILKDVRTKNTESGESGFHALPFGPAMAVSFMLIMFFGNEIHNCFSALFKII